METKKIDTLDALRWIAILWVILWHLTLLGITIPWPLHVWMMGVPLFFMVSSYTLILSQKKRVIQNSGWIKQFFMRRLFRIYPTYFIIWTLIFILSTLYWYNPAIINNWMNIILHITFLFWFHESYMGGLSMWEWSLFNEVIFYSLFPLLFLHINSLGRSLFFLISSFIICYLVNIFWDWMLGVTKSYIYTLPLTHLFSFSLGFALYYMKDLVITCNRYSAYMSLISFWALSFYQINYWMHLFPFMIINIWVLVFFIINGHFCHMVNPVTCFLGKISYSLYLIHINLFIYIWTLPVPTFEKFLLGWLLAVIWAFVSYKYIELPFIKLGQKLLK